MPSTSRCLRSSEQAARTSQLPPLFLSLPLVHLPSRSTLDRRLKTPRSPGEAASIFTSCPRQPRQQKHRHREDAARVENGIARAFGESRRVPPTFRKTRRFFKFTAANQTTPRRPPFQETSRCCFAGHLRSFVLFFVVRHTCPLSSGRQPHFVFPPLALSLACPPFFLLRTSTGRASCSLPSSQRALPQTLPSVPRRQRSALSDCSAIFGSAAFGSSKRAQSNPTRRNLRRLLSSFRHCSGRRAVSQSDKIILLPHTLCHCLRASDKNAPHSQMPFSTLGGRVPRDTGSKRALACGHFAFRLFFRLTLSSHLHSSLTSHATPVSAWYKKGAAFHIAH